jgi:hypothetical protein
MHFNEAEGTFVNTSNLNGGSVEQGSEISTINAGYSLVMLGKFIEEFAGTPLEGMAQSVLVAQANFIINNLKNSSNGFYNSYTIGVGADNGDEDVVAIAGAIRGLYAAFVTTNDSTYLSSANSAYEYLINNFYLPSQMAFLTNLNTTTAVYTPYNFAIIAGALREASLVGGNSDAPIIYTRFFKKIGNQMQLSEAGATGEVGNDSDGDGIPFIAEQADGLPPIFAPQATFDLITAVEDNPIISKQFILNQNYPNPFNPSTEIKYQVPTSGYVSLSVYNMIGEKVATLIDEVKTKGQHSVKLNSESYKLASGVYMYKLSQNNNVSVKKMILLK